MYSFNKVVLMCVLRCVHVQVYFSVVLLLQILRPPHQCYHPSHTTNFSQLSLFFQQTLKEKKVRKWFYITNSIPWQSKDNKAYFISCSFSDRMFLNSDKQFHVILSWEFSLFFQNVWQFIFAFHKMLYKVQNSSWVNEKLIC